MRKFGVLVIKELRELITVQMLLPFLIVVVMFAALGNIVGEQGDRSQQDVRTIIVLDMDGTASSEAVGDALGSAGYSVEPAEVKTAEQIPDAMREAGEQLAVVIPVGFENGLGGSEPQEIQTFVGLENFSFTAATDSGMISGILNAVNMSISDSLIRDVAPDADPAALKRPVVGVEHVVIGERDAQAGVAEVMGFITQQTTFIPIVLFVVILMAAQMIATTIASEKENKTLETMLSMPVSRTAIIGAKMVAASTVALLSAVAYMYGMRSYMDGLSSGMGNGGSLFSSSETDALAELGLQLGSVDYALLGLALFFSILVALAIAVILGAFAENVKAVQALMAPLMVLIMVPYFLTLFVDLGQVSPVVKWLVLAIPFSHPFMAAPNLFLGNYSTVLAGIAYEAVCFAALVIVAGRIFSSDRILTMKLSMGKSRFPALGRGRRVR